MEAKLYNGNSRIWIRREPGCDFNLYGALNAGDSPSATDSISKIPKTASVTEACDFFVEIGWSIEKKFFDKKDLDHTTTSYYGVYEVLVIGSIKEGFVVLDTPRKRHLQNSTLDECKRILAEKKEMHKAWGFEYVSISPTQMVLIGYANHQMFQIFKD